MNLEFSEEIQLPKQYILMVFNIFICQGNINENYFEILSYPTQDG